MRVLYLLLQKEFRQIFRNKSILRIIFIMPVMQLVILPQAADYEIRNINITIVDRDRSDLSAKLIQSITSSGYFILQHYADEYDEAIVDIESDKSDLVLDIPPSFSRDLVKENSASVSASLNAINGSRAGLGGAYLQAIIREFNQELRIDWIRPGRFPEQPIIEVMPVNWFNPLMNYKLFMVPGILVVLVTMVGSFLAALNIVKEKEGGTMEQINVTPIKKYQFILGKLIPFWVLGLLIMSLGLSVGWLVYGIIPSGSLLTIYIFAAVYLLAVLGLGLLVSTISATQQQAMLISFFLMMIFILMGGLYTSIESMPRWAQWISYMNPVTYFISVMRMVVLKGSGLNEIIPQLLTVLVFAVVLNAWAIANYRKRT